LFSLAFLTLDSLTIEKGEKVMATEEQDIQPTNELKKGWVVSALPPVAGDPFGGSQVALYEVDGQHPGGQAFVAGARPVEVAYTPGVVAAIRSGRVRELSASDASAENKRLDDEATKRRDAARAAERDSSPGAVVVPQSMTAQGAASTTAASQPAEDAAAAQSRAKK
jgi:hypothetical protein